LRFILTDYKTVFGPAKSRDQIAEQLMGELVQLENDIFRNSRADKNKIISAFFDFIVTRIRAGDFEAVRKVIKRIHDAAFGEHWTQRRSKQNKSTPAA